MTTLKIKFFGNICINIPNSDSKVKLTRSSKSLLSYLLLYRNRLHNREVLASVFWGEYNNNRARNCLNTVLWRLRCVLEPTTKGTYLRVLPTGEIGFNNESDYWLDVEAFENQITQALKEPVHAIKFEEASRLENVLKLYRGELLEGFYDDWVLVERDRLNGMYFSCLEYLMQFHDYHKSYENAIQYGIQILNKDPLREEIHRELMNLYMKNKNRIQAIRQYECCRKLLKEELGVEPMDETKYLYRKVVKQADLEFRTSYSLNQRYLSIAELETLELLYQKTRLALNDIDLLRDKLHQAYQLINQPQ
jgi:DNA-binding SARP family transcriptional activator